MINGRLCFYRFENRFKDRANGQVPRRSWLLADRALPLAAAKSKLQICLNIKGIEVLTTIASAWVLDPAAGKGALDAEECFTSVMIINHTDS